MLFRKSNKFKLLSMLLIAASLSTGLIACGSSSNNTASNVKEETQNNDAKDSAKENEDKKNADAKDAAKEQTAASSDNSDIAPVQNPQGIEDAIEADDSDYHSAQAVDNANSKQEGFVESDTVETAPEGKVYIMQGSTKYHTKSKCGKLSKSKCIDKNIAEAAGYSACPDCAN